jgi:cytochrome c2
MIRACLLALAPAVAAYGAVVAADSERGAALFESLHCVQCHSVSGKGGRVGADLGRLADRNFTPASLAATMWNHAPTMWAAIRASEVRTGDLDEQAAADLFAFFYSARFFERPGDAARGKRVLEAKCARCHGLKSSTVSGIPPVAEWKRVNTPFDLITSMWNHQPRMQAASVAQGIPLPTLTAQDLIDLLVYVRHIPGAVDSGAVFQTSAGTDGPKLLESKGCNQCHHTGAPLADRIKGRTLTDIAAAMWNHGPAMRTAGATPAHFEPGEMRDLLSYLWARQFFESSGTATRGMRVFSSKGCASCHANPASGAPKIAGGAHRFSAASMVSALWGHGPAMLEAMKKQGKPWPRFTGVEMADLIAYLNSAGGAK